MTPAPANQRSLFGEILDWMLAPLLLLWPMSVVLTWLVAQGIANRPFDRELGDMVRVLSRQVKTVPVEEARPAIRAPGAMDLLEPASDLLPSPPAAAARPGRLDRAPSIGFALPPGIEEMLHDGEDTLYYQVTGLRGEWVSGERRLPSPPEPEPLASGEVRFRDDTVEDQPVRIAYLWLPMPEPSPAGAARGTIAPPLVQVAETLGKRSRLATEIIKGVILPQFVILPLAVLLVWLALARGIAPLNDLQRRIRLRDSNDLSPIDERQAPEEVSPLVRAINDLLGRLDHSIRTQKHFLADAAHQLKTPLAGLRTQAELAQRQIDAGQTDAQALKASLAQIAHSSQRAAHMVNQLLSMARAENQEDAMRKEPVSLSRLAPLTVRDFVPRAMDKRIDLGFEGPTSDDEAAGLWVHGQPVLLGELIRNLVDNALAYTPPGGTVTVRVVDDPFGQVVVLQVEDSGPGIAAAERERVFQPFYRGLGTAVDGSGLGLAIVREIALAHDAEVLLDDALPRQGADAAQRSGGCGARFTVRFAALPVRPRENALDSRSPPGGP